MYSMNPGLAGALADDRVAELRRSAASRAPRAGGSGLRSLRRTAGWFLVSLGLHLVLPRRSVRPRRSMLPGGLQGGSALPSGPVLPGRSVLVRRSALRAAR
jgi:hypothetical protein